LSVKLSCLSCRIASAFRELKITNGFTLVAENVHKICFRKAKGKDV